MEQLHNASETLRTPAEQTRPGSVSNTQRHRSRKRKHLAMLIERKPWKRQPKGPETKRHGNTSRIRPDLLQASNFPVSSVVWGSQVRSHSRLQLLYSASLSLLHNFCHCFPHWHAGLTQNQSAEALPPRTSLHRADMQPEGVTPSMETGLGPCSS